MDSVDELRRKYYTFVSTCFIFSYPHRPKVISMSLCRIRSKPDTDIKRLATIKFKPSTYFLKVSI